MINRLVSLPRLANGRAPLLIAFATFVSLAIPSSIINVAWDYIYTEFEQPYDALGILLLFYTSGRLISTFSAGRVIASIGIWKSVIAGMTISIVGLVGALISPTWITLLLSMVLLAFGGGMMDIGFNVYVASRFRPGIINFLHASYGLGLTLGPQIVSLVVITLGRNWRLSYLTPLIVLLVLWIWAFSSRALWTLPEREGASPNPRAASIRATLMLPVMWVWLLFALLYGGFEVGTGQLSNDLLTKARGLDVGVASTWISLYYATFTAGRFLSGFIAGRFSEATLIFGCCIIAVVGAVMVYLPGLSLTLPGLILIGVSLAGVFPTLISAIPRRFGLEHAPNAMGFTIGMSSAGTAILPGLGAFIAARMGFAAIGPYILVMGVALLLSYVLIARQSRPRNITAVNG